VATSISTTKRLVKGSELTFAEGDANWTAIENQINDNNQFAIHAGTFTYAQINALGAVAGGLINLSATIPAGFYFTGHVEYKTVATLNPPSGTTGMNTAQVIQENGAGVDCTGMLNGYPGDKLFFAGNCNSYISASATHIQVSFSWDTVNPANYTAGSFDVWIMVRKAHIS
jgi:hypothetical protein